MKRGGSNERSGLECVLPKFVSINFLDTHIRQLLVKSFNIKLFNLRIQVFYGLCSCNSHDSVLQTLFYRFVHHL